MKTFSTRLDRRGFLKGVSSAGLLAVSGRSSLAQSGGKSIFIEPFDLILEFLPELNAAAGGHFQKQGLDLEIINARGTSLSVQQLVAKQASFTKLGALDLIKAYDAQNVPLVSVATIQQSAIFNVVSLKSSPILSPSDMKGKTIGVASLGGGTENNLDLMLAGAGLAKTEVSRQAVGMSPGNVELLKAGRIAAFFATVEGAVALKRSNAPVEIWNIDRFAPIPGGAYVVTKEFADSEPEKVSKFIRALQASVREILSEDANKILDRVEGKFEITGEKARDFRLDAVKTYNELIMGKGAENVLKNVPSVWRASAELAQKAGIATVTNIDELYTNRFLDQSSK